jgi:hypothetical protein
VEIAILIGGGSRSAPGEETHHFSRLGVPPSLVLRKHQVAIDRDIEYAPGRLYQAHFGLRVLLPDLGRQTDGPWLVVSGDAVLDAHAHL